MNKEPKVSIAIPLYNCESHIRETLDSLLSQTYEDFQVTIIDDQSSDDSYHIAKTYDDSRFRVIRNIERQGFFGNWNACLEHMNGAYCKLLPHDDPLEPTCLEKQVRVLDEHPDVTLVHNARKIIDPAGTILTTRRAKEAEGKMDFKEVLRKIVRSGTNPIGEPASVMFRQSTKRSIDGFSNEDMYSIDIEYWIRLMAKGKKYYINEILSSFRVWPESASVRLFGSQSRSMTAFFRRLEKQYPHILRTSDVLTGSLRSVVLEVARGGFYLLMKVKN